MSLSASGKPRICLALPGVNYTPHSPYVRSTLPMVPYLEKDFEVTLLYRKILDIHAANHMEHQYLTLLGKAADQPAEQRNRHPYYSPHHYPALWQYQSTIQAFAQQHADRFDLVFEKEWPWLGAVSSAFRSWGVPTVMLIEAWYTRKPPSPHKHHIKRLLSIGLQDYRWQKRQVWAQDVNSLVVETDEMREVLLEAGYVKDDMPITPIPYGVDEEIFALRDRNQCRQALGIAEDAYVLTYVGSMNRFIQEPGPIIEALGQCQQRQNLVLYMVGDGSKQGELETLAQRFKAPVVFTGRLPQEKAAQYVSAANLCIAPYNKDLYWGGKFTCASLKVPEYFSCGRLVLTVSCERMEFLTDHEKYGFLVENTVEGYAQFLAHLPSPENLALKEKVLVEDAQLGILKQKNILLRWSDIGDAYRQVFNEILNRQKSLQSGSLLVS
ncbi:MAG: hypothetical protein DCF32_08880 [Leptolyngbya sp.]|nr:MAG: hypothetical protein DCF32_08880 [Leptolyngbya sp.]